MQRSWTIGLALGVVVAALAWLLLPRSHNDGARIDQAPADGPVAPEVASPEVVPPEVVEAPRLVGAGSATPAVDAVPTHGARRVYGTLRVKDPANGTWSESETGRVTLRRDVDYEARTTRVVAGRWALTLDEQDQASGWSVVGGLLGGRAFGPREQDQQSVAMEAPGGPRIEGEYYPSLSFHVVGRESRRELADIELTYAYGDGYDGPYPGQYLPHPVRAAASPFDLWEVLSSRVAVPRETMLTVWARSPGRAWGRIVVDPDADDERTLALGTGGTLAVTLVGLAASNPPRLLVEHEDEVLMRFMTAGRAAYEFESFPSGRVRVVARMGDSPHVTESGAWEETAPLGEAKAEVPAGGHVSVTVTLGASPARVRVPLRGTVVFPPGRIPRDSMQFTARLLDSPRSEGADETHYATARAAGEGRYAFDFLDVEPGRYELGFTGPDYGWVRVPEAGATDVEIRLPEYVLLRGVTIDDRMGFPVGVGEIFWSAVRPWNLNGGGVLTVVKLDGPHFEIRVPPMPIRLSPSSDEWQGGLVVDPTTQAIPAELRVRRSSGIRLRLTEGDREVPWSSWGEWHLEIERIEGDVTDPDAADLWGEGYARVVKPGRHRITIPANDEYETVPPFEVEIPEGTWLDREVPVLRRR